MPLFTADGHVLMFNESGIATFFDDTIADKVAHVLNDDPYPSASGLRDTLWDKTSGTFTNTVVSDFLDGEGG